MRVKRLFFHYGLTILMCLTIVFTSMLVCWSNCEFSQCEQLCRSNMDVHMRNSKLNKDEELTRRLVNYPTKIFLVVLIFSSTSNMEQRDTIRQTWLKNKKSLQVLHFFAVGSGRLDSEEKVTLTSEQTRFGDLLLLPSVNDSYSALSQKLLHSLVWLHERIEFGFLLKVDDDSFVKLDVIVDELHSLKNKHRLYWGFFNGHAQVKKAGHWQEREWILCDTYLPYALGGGYVISYDLLTFVAKNSEYLKLYNSEDVSLGTWLAPLDINRIHDPRFDTEFKSRGCFNVYIITHKQSIEQLREKHFLLKEKGKICSEQLRTRYSYIYNWKVPPSQCCFRNDSTIP